jgi:N-acetylmuramoyl-L-alanine amidase
MTCLKIYLSPSNQINNLYVTNNTNEKIEMEKIAFIVKELLANKYNCEVIMATLRLPITDRASEAKENNSDIYLAIHSNAGGGGKASGAVAFYHPEFIDGKRLAANLVNELDKISPVKSNRVDPVRNGMDQFGGKGLAEIRLPGELGITPILVEINFHDNPLTAKWIINSTEKIAKAIVNAINLTFDINSKSILSFKRN